MDWRQVLDIASLLISIVGVAIGIYAVLDSRRQIKRFLAVLRDKMRGDIMNDLAWTYIEPTGTAHNAATAMKIVELCLLEQTTTPRQDDVTSKSGLEREALALANDLVEHGYARWKQGLNMTKLKKILQELHAEKNNARIQNLFNDRDSNILG